MRPETEATEREWSRIFFLDCSLALLSNPAVNLLLLTCLCHATRRFALLSLPQNPAWNRAVPSSFCFFHLPPSTRSQFSGGHSSSTYTDPWHGVAQLQNPGSKTGSVPAIRKNAEPGSALNQCGSTTLPETFPVVVPITFLQLQNTISCYRERHSLFESWISCQRTINSSSRRSTGIHSSRDAARPPLSGMENITSSAAFSTST